jgi:LPXTG-motif cell wall-anchored protein
LGGAQQPSDGETTTEKSIQTDDPDQPVTKKITTNTKTDPDPIKTEKIEPKPKYQQDSSLDPGTTKIINDGKTGSKTITTKTTTTKTEYDVPITVQVINDHEPITTGEGTKKIVTRDIYIQFPGQWPHKYKTQEVTLHRSGTKDVKTGKITWGAWSTGTMAVAKAPYEAGYAVTNPNHGPAVPVDGSKDKLADVVFQYSANDQSVKVNYVDDSTHQVPNSISVSGKTGETVSFDAQSHVPEGYVIVSGQTIPDSFTFTATPLDSVSILVHYNYNSKYHVSVPDDENVITHVGANVTSPTLDSSNVKLNWTDEYGNTISKPAGTQVTWASVPDTTKIANETGTLNITFADGTTTSVQIPVIVQGATTLKVLEVKRGEGQQKLNVSKARYLADKSIPSLAASNSSIQEDSSANKDKLPFTIKKQKEQVYIGSDLKDILPSDFIDGLPEGANVELVWDEGSSTSTVGTIHGHIKITLPTQTTYKTTMNITPAQDKVVAYNNETVTKTITRTIHYRGAGEQTPQDEVEIVTFRRTATFDESRGYFSWTDWSATLGSFSRVETPKIPGYTADIKVVEASTPSVNDSSFTVVVTYTPNDSPHIPDIPKTPDDKDKPGKPSEQPTDKPAKEPSKHPADKTAEKKQAKKNAVVSTVHKSQVRINKQQTAKAALPQTGDKNDKFAVVSGIVAVLAGMAALAYLGKKKNN